MLAAMNDASELHQLSPVEVHDQLLRRWIVLIDGARSAGAVVGRC